MTQSLVNALSGNFSSATGGITDIVSNGTYSQLSMLSQNATNGNSIFGTLGYGTLGQFLTSNPLPNGYPWSNYAPNSTTPPDTGVTRSYEWIVKRGQLAPDGVMKEMILVNDAFPGPQIEANWGDMIEVIVHNQITEPEEGVSMHWHGLRMLKTPWMDGVPSVSQCPIAPNSSFTYRFQADSYGTSWWHSHYSAQWAAGLFGPIIIHGPQHVPYDIDLGPVMIGDHVHTEYFKVVEGVEGTDLKGIVPGSDNNLINGKNYFNCSLIAANSGIQCHDSAGLSKFRFTTGKTHLLRLVNVGTQWLQHFSIDGHNLTVIATDFIPIVPYDTSILDLAPGQRADILVMATGNDGDAYYMRTKAICAIMNNNTATAQAVILYSEANDTIVPTSKPWEDNLSACAGTDYTQKVPFYPIPVNPNPTTVQSISVSFAFNATGQLEWKLDNQTFRGNYNNPVLLLAKLGNTSYPDDPQWNVYNFGNNATIRINVHNTTPFPHPLHFHGHHMQLLSVGNGPWDGSIPNTANPPRRDVQMLPASGHLVMQYEADNPGVWAFHCHIAWHVSQGFFANFMERTDDIANLSVPMVNAQTCRDWAAWTGENVVAQIDSGL